MVPALKARTFYTRILNMASDSLPPQAVLTRYISLVGDTVLPLRTHPPTFSLDALNWVSWVASM